MIEKRGSKRFKKKIPLAFSDGTKEYKGLSSDLSSTGLFIITRDPLRPGTQIKIALEVPDKKIFLNGVVVRTVKTGIIEVKDRMGIKLTETPYLYQKFITRLEEE
jgi:Tfp pilus assembly protein PilZ